MSQQDLPKTPAPIAHRYDPRQPVSLPLPPARSAADVPARDVPTQAPRDPAPTDPATAAHPQQPAERPVEIGGPTGPEPTRYGDWERNGRVSDF